MIKSVLFDLDETLLDRATSVKKFVSAQYDRFITNLSHISQVDYVARFIELDCRGHIWKDQVYQVLVTEFEIAGISWQQLLADYETQFQFYCVPFPGLVEMLETLKQQGYLLGIVTNGRGEFQARSISGLGIRDYFDVVLISELEQLRKPQPEIFQRAIDRLGTSAKDSVFVGDNPEADIVGANNANLWTIWKRNPYYSAPKTADAIIDELAEIPSIVRQLI